MKKILFITSTLIFSTFAYAQIGLNEDAPQATLDIKPKIENINNETLEGILIPRVSKLKAYKMTTNELPIQESTLIYINNLSSEGITDNTKVSQITEKGFYFWNENKWIKSIGATGKQWDSEANKNIIFTSGNDILISNKKIDVNNLNNDTRKRLGTLTIKKEVTTGEEGVNILGIRSEVKATGLPAGHQTNLDVNGYWANVESDGGASVNGIYVHAKQTKANFSILSGLNPQKLLNELSLVSGTYGSAEVADPSSFYIAVGAGGMSESSQYGVNTGVNGVARNSQTMNFGVNAIVKATNDQIKNYYKSKIPSGFFEKLKLNYFSAAVSAYNPATGKNDYAIYAKGAKSKIEGDLQVTGNLMASNFPVPDYVFEKYYKGYSNIKEDYDFKKLNEVETFVKKNGHLPGYKSASEVSKEGFINIGATQLTNIEKIEELYLHAIEQDKALKEKISEVSTLKEELQKQKESLETKDAKIKELEARLERIEKLLEK